ncbi:MAG: cyclic nucleotide-binding domain-containing protein, partial [Chloroflexales bacterium]|nr:cyclic nucleotide-binding domain-containing protein [Chloroflexales bacterium]
LHAQGFVHNDISPTNLYWHAEGAIVLASFGYASPTGTRLAEVMTADDDGPTSAMVPGLTAEGALTPATDLYCFARALIALATQAIRTLPQLVLDVLTQPLRPGAARFERATAYIDAIRAAVEGSAQGEARSPDITASAEDESRPIVGAKRAHEAPRFTELVEQLRRPAHELVRWCRTMLVEEFRHGLAFRVVVLAKLILDLDPASPARVELDGRPWLVGDLINSISQRSYSGQAGQRVLYDPFLSPLSPVTLTYLLERSRLIPYQAGAPVVRQDEPADALFIVVTGALELYRNEARLKVLSPDGEMTDVVLEEGSIFGEMSLFAQSPRYAATLVARQPTAVLSLAYGDIVGVNMPGRVTENHIRVELRAHLWRYYTSRTIEQHIQWHELLKHLPPKAQTVLTHSARFIPANYSDEVTISAAELWEEWVLIIAGAITVYTNSASLTYTAGDWIGPLRLVVETNPYTEVACSRDAQFVAIPADLIMSVTDENESFRKSCVLMALNERMRLVA